MSAPYEVLNREEIMDNATIEEYHNGGGKLTNAGRRRLAKLEAHLNKVQQEYEDEKLAKALQLECDRALDYSNRVTAASGKAEARKVQRKMNTLEEGWAQVVKGKAVVQEQNRKTQAVVREFKDKEEQRLAFHDENERLSALALKEIDAKEQAEALKRLEQQKLDEKFAKLLLEQQKLDEKFAVTPAVKPVVQTATVKPQKLDKPEVKTPAVKPVVQTATVKPQKLDKPEVKTPAVKQESKPIPAAGKRPTPEEVWEKYVMHGDKALTVIEDCMLSTILYAEIRERVFAPVVQQAPEPVWTSVVRGNSKKTSAKKGGASKTYKPTSWGDSLCE